MTVWLTTGHFFCEKTPQGVHRIGEAPAKRQRRNAAGTFPEIYLKTGQVNSIHEDDVAQLSFPACVRAPSHEAEAKHVEHTSHVLGT